MAHAFDSHLIVGGRKQNAQIERKPSVKKNCLTEVALAARLPDHRFALLRHAAVASWRNTD